VLRAWATEEGSREYEVTLSARKALVLLPLNIATSLSLRPLRAGFSLAQAADDFMTGNDAR
jgi:hypothetical protein